MTAVELERRLVAAILAAGEVSPEAGHRVVDRIRGAGIAPSTFRNPSLRGLLELLLVERDASRPLDCRSIAVALESAAIEGMGDLAVWVVDSAVTLAPPDAITARLLDACDAGTARFSSAAADAARLVLLRAAETGEPDLEPSLARTAA